MGELWLASPHPDCRAGVKQEVPTLACFRRPKLLCRRVIYEILLRNRVLCAMSHGIDLRLCAVAALLALTAWAVDVLASDPENTSDFVVPPGVNISSIDGNYFTYTGFRGGIMVAPGKTGAKKATVNEFPALQGLGISFFLMYFQPMGLLPLHYHPRGSKLIYVIEGTLTVGFVDTTNKLYTQTLLEGDVFVIPKAMVHYMANFNSYRETKVIFSFSSCNPGSLQLPNAIFGSTPRIPEAVLEKSFGVSEMVIHQLESPYGWSP